MSKMLEKSILETLDLGVLSKEKLIKKLNIKGRSQQESFNETINKLEAEGKIFIDEKNMFHIFDGNIKYIQGTVFINIDGTGYFKGKKNGENVRFEIPHEWLNGAISGDIVVIKDKHKKHYDRKQASVLKVVKRHERSNIFQYIGDGLFKLYDGSSDVYLYKREKECNDVVVGSLVLANIDRNPVIDNIYTGETIKVVGHMDDPKAIIRAVGLKYGFDNEFSQKVIEEAKQLPTEVQKEELEGRKDLRKETIFTIDGDDTKDIDDAVSIIKQDDNYIVKVHIADVSHYLKDKKSLLNEAMQRGNSAYLANSVFPMLPHLLSNGICSLNPNVDRLTKTVEMKIDQDGNIISSEVYKSVIRSRKQMTYDQVNKVLKGEKVEEYEKFQDDLRLMNKVAKLLEKNRKEKGAIDFYSHELKMSTDIKGKVLGIKPSVHDDAERLIESLMIAANTEVTKHYGYLDTPFIYRVHREPNPKKLLTTLAELKGQEIQDTILNDTISELQKQLNGKKTVISPQTISSFLNRIKDKDYYESVSDTILQCMERAVYSHENIGHFGLANKDYSHFTSPIRRAADLTNHIIIDLIMDYYNAKDENSMEKIETQLINIAKKLPDICENISETELLADQAEKEAEKIELAEYFSDHIKDYDGPLPSKIKYINKLGIFANLDIFNVFIPKIELQRQGFNYKRQSRTYVSKKETLKIGDEAYLLYPEVSKETSTIIYNEISKDENNLLAPEKPKRLIKTRKINPNENPQ